MPVVVADDPCPAPVRVRLAPEGGMDAPALVHIVRDRRRPRGARSYHGATLKWLAALSRVLPETSGILEKIGSYDVAALGDPSLSSVHDELLFLLGRNYYRRGGDGDFDKAISLFKQVSRQSEFFIKA